MSSSTSESDLHELDTLLSPDINLPSIAYQAKQGVPIILPCSPQGRRIALGSGLETSALVRADEGLDPVRPSAFDNRPHQGAHRVEFTGGVSSFRQASSTHTSSSYDHLDIQGSLSVGYSFLGASCQASFNKDVQGNRDATKVSLKYALRIGRIVLSSHPRLSREALTLLRTSADAFREKYGDYYLYALTIGASATTFLSTSSTMNLESEMHDIQVKAHVLWMNPTVFHDEGTSHSASTTYDATYSGFDTLSGYSKTMHASDKSAYIDAKTEAGKNVARSEELEKRVNKVLGDCGVKRGEEIVLAENQLEAVYVSGVVVEVMFLPYTMLRDYVTARAAASE